MPACTLPSINPFHPLPQFHSSSHPWDLSSHKLISPSSNFTPLSAEHLSSHKPSSHLFQFHLLTHLFNFWVNGFLSLWIVDLSCSNFTSNFTPLHNHMCVLLSQYSHYCDLCVCFLFVSFYFENWITILWLLFETHDDQSYKRRCGSAGFFFLLFFLLKIWLSFMINSVFCLAMRLVNVFTYLWTYIV